MCLLISSFEGMVFGTNKNTFVILNNDWTSLMSVGTLKMTQKYKSDIKKST